MFASVTLKLRNRIEMLTQEMIVKMGFLGITKGRFELTILGSGLKMHLEISSLLKTLLCLPIVEHPYFYREKYCLMKNF